MKRTIEAGELEKLKKERPEVAAEIEAAIELEGDVMVCDKKTLFEIFKKHRPNHPDRKSRGIGDTIEKVTKAIGITPCGGCKARRDKLNEAFPYK